MESGVAAPGMVMRFEFVLIQSFTVSFLKEEFTRLNDCSKSLWILFRRKFDKKAKRKKLYTTQNIFQRNDFGFTSAYYPANFAFRIVNCDYVGNDV